MLVLDSGRAWDCQGSAQARSTRAALSAALALSHPCASVCTAETSWPRTETMEIRIYTSADREACLDLLRSNVPEHFVASNEADYGSFLDRLPGRYFVVAGDD